MREVSGCDFCGETASGTFDVLPPEYDPQGNGKRMVLCDHCRDALASILDPLLDATGRDVEPSVEDVADGATDAEPAEPTPEGPDADTADQAPPAEEQRAEARMAKTGAGSSSRVPRGYRKTLRFLENREMPLDHDEAVEMVAGAYGLEETAVEAAIEHAANHGRLKLLSGEIHRA
jgi:hypothetical protein